MGGVGGGGGVGWVGGVNMWVGWGGGGGVECGVNGWVGLVRKGVLGELGEEGWGGRGWEVGWVVCFWGRR